MGLRLTQIEAYKAQYEKVMEDYHEKVYYWSGTPASLISESVKLELRNMESEIQFIEDFFDKHGINPLDDQDPPVKQQGV